MQSPGSQTIAIRRFGLLQKSDSHRLAHLRRHRQQGAGGGADIAMQDRSHRYQAGRTTLAAGPAPNRAESCTTSSSAGDTSPSDACAAAP